MNVKVHFPVANNECFVARHMGNAFLVL
jgi:hypothetical protein